MSKHESGQASSHPETRDDLDWLLGAVARGEHGAFDLVYEQLREPIHNQVRAVLRDPAQSEEVTSTLKHQHEHKPPRPPHQGAGAGLLAAVFGQAAPASPGIARMRSKVSGSAGSPGLVY